MEFESNDSKEYIWVSCLPVSSAGHSICFRHWRRHFPSDETAIQAEYEV